MKLSFSTLGCPEWSWSEIVSTAGDLGYDGIEIRGVARDIYAPDVPQFRQGGAARTRALLQEKKLEVPCLASDCVLHLAPFRDRTVKELTAYIALARELGVPYVRVMGDNPQPWPGAPVDEDHVYGLASELAPLAADNGVTLLVETNGWYSNTAHLRKLLERIDHPGVAALWDVHHPYRYNSESAKETYANIGPWIKHVHLKDSTLTDRVRYQMMGYGDLPLETFFDVLKEGGYDGFYSLEWVRRWDLTLEMPGIVFAQYISYMRGL